MNNKIVDKRDLVMNQAKEMLLNILKDHKDNEFCNYVYYEAILGVGIEQLDIDCIKDEMLTLDGEFKVKEDKKGEQYSMEDLIGSLIHYLSISLNDRALAYRAEGIIWKYGIFTYLWGIECCLKEALLGIKEECFEEYYSSFEKMIEEYILKA